MDFKKFAKDIIDNVGGVENIQSLTHCITRLRFQLKDEKKANDNIIKNMEGVATVVHSAGQYQVVIGKNVIKVYDTIVENYNIGETEPSEATSENENKGSFMKQFIKLVTGIMMPSLSILCACGMLKGLNSVATFFGLYSNDSGIYTLLNAIGDSIFFFFPIVIGYNMAKTINIKNPYLGLIIGAAICYPTINGVDVELFGNVINATYTSTIFPVILMVALAKPLEKLFNKVIPSIVSNFLTPMFVMMITVTLGYIILGPIANAVSLGLSNSILAINDFSPILTGFIAGALWQVMVVFGVQILLVVVAINNITAGIPDPILPFTTFVAFSTTGSIIAIWLKTRNKQLKSAALPAWISGLFGITEPAIYGILVQRPRQFVLTCINGGITGILVAYFGMKYYTMAGMGIFEIPAILNPSDPKGSFIHAVITTAVAFALGFVLSYLTFKDEKQDGATI